MSNGLYKLETKREKLLESFLLHDFECTYAGMQAMRIHTRESRWVLRERFVVAASSSPSSYKRDSRVPRLWSRGMLSGCIMQRFSLPFVHGRLASRHPLEKHDLIYYEPHSRRRRVMSCAFALSAF